MAGNPHAPRVVLPTFGQTVQRKRLQSGARVKASVAPESAQDDKARGNEAGVPKPDLARRAWSAYDACPEIARLVQTKADMLGLVDLVLAWQPPDSTKSLPVRDKEGNVIDGLDEDAVLAAERALASIGNTARGRARLVASIAVNLGVQGACWVLGESPARNADGMLIDPAEQDRWSAHASLRKERDYWQTAGGRRVPKSRATVMHIWDPHPKDPDTPRGWVSGVTRLAQLVQTLERAAEAAALSTVPASLLLVALQASPLRPDRGMLEGTGFPGEDGVEDGSGGDWVSAQEYSEADAEAWAGAVDSMIQGYLSDAVDNANSGRRIMPGIIALDERFVKENTGISKIDLSRKLDKELILWLEFVLNRIAKVAETPRERLDGLAATNRWNAEKITDDEYRRDIRPVMDLIADAFTERFVRPEILRATNAIEFANGIVVVPDPARLIGDPDVAETALDGLKLGAIGPAGWREMMHVPHDYAPTEEELAQTQNTDSASVTEPSNDGERVVGSAKSLSPDELNELGKQLADLDREATIALATALAAHGLTLKEALANNDDEAVTAAMHEAGITTVDHANEEWLAVLLLLGARGVKLPPALNLEVLSESSRIHGERAALEWAMRAAQAESRASAVPEIPVKSARIALATAGGGQPGLSSSYGLATGPAALSSLPKPTGVVFAYGSLPRDNPYTTHRDVLNGMQFSSESDPSIPTGPFGKEVPGNHTGCLCFWQPAWSQTALPQITAG